MKTLSKDRYDAARSFLAGLGRPLEWAQFLWRFEQGNPDDVVATLAPYQNADGGFGRSLEPDLRTPRSSVLATTMGLRILHNVRLGPEHEMVRGALSYLLERWDESLHAWSIVPPEPDEHPHAPWFDRGPDFAKRWHNFQANPKAEVVGYLWIWDDIVPDSFLCQVCEETARWLAESADLLEMHEVLCYLRLVEHPALPQERRSTLLPDLRRAVDHVLERDPARWGGYCLQPLDVAPTPHSPLVDMVRSLMPKNLDHLLESQGRGGAWEPAWDWRGRAPEAWAEARREWCSIITLQALCRLSAWGRLETEES